MSSHNTKDFSIQKPIDPSLHHSAISEKFSSEESEEETKSQIKLLNSFLLEDDSLIDCLLLNQKETFGEIDYELCFIKNDIEFITLGTIMRKTSFFFVKNKESIVTIVDNRAENNKDSLLKSAYNPDISKQPKSLLLQNRRASQSISVQRNSKSHRIESLGKIRSDLISKLNKPVEKNYNFIIDGQKYQVF